MAKKRRIKLSKNENPFHVEEPDFPLASDKEVEDTFAPISDPPEGYAEKIVDIIQRRELEKRFVEQVLIVDNFLKKVGDAIANIRAYAEVGEFVGKVDLDELENKFVELVAFNDYLFFGTYEKYSVRGES